MEKVATPTDQRARRNRQGDHVLQRPAKHPGRQIPLFVHGHGDFPRCAGGQQEHAAIVDGGIRQRNPQREEGVAAAAIVVVRAPAGRALRARHPMRPDDRVLEIALTDRTVEEGGNARHARDVPEIVEGEGHGPAVGAHGLDRAPHPGDPNRIENFPQFEVAFPIEAVFFTRGVFIGNPRGLAVGRLAFADRGERRKTAPSLDVQRLLEALPRLFRRQFGIFEKGFGHRRDLLRRHAHHPADRTWAKSGRRSSVSPGRNPRSKTSRGIVSFRKFTGS